MHWLCVLIFCAFLGPMLTGVIYILGSDFIEAWERVQMQRAELNRKDETL